MNNIRSKYYIIAAAAILLVFVIIVIVTSHSSPKPSNQTATNSSALPANALNPTSVVKQLPAYVNKPITVEGNLYKFGTNYEIVGQPITGAPTPGALTLDFSKTKIDPNPYLINAPASKPTKGPDRSSRHKPVYLTGQLTKSVGGPPILVVSALFAS